MKINFRSASSFKFLKVYMRFSSDPSSFTLQTDKNGGGAPGYVGQFNVIGIACSCRCVVYAMQRLD